MNIICWNCQGLGTPLTVQELKALVAFHRPDIIFLMETKNREAVVQKLRRTLGFSNCRVVDPIGIAGGLAMFWDDAVTINFEAQSESFMDITIKDVICDKWMRFTFIHAPFNFQRRLNLWRELRGISDANMLPWVCMGDFNEVLFHWEKADRNMADQYRMTAFRDVLDDCSFMEIDNKGCAFTWSNNRAGEENIRERLDRVLCNIEWRVLFPEAESFALPAIGSDHSPLLLSIRPKEAKRTKHFKFEAFWLEHDECKQIIQQAWSIPTRGPRNLIKKLIHVTNALTMWSKTTFKNSRKRICELKQELQGHLNSSHLQFEKDKIKQIQAEIETMWRQEEMYWGFRSRINWLKWGDQNIKFFHATTIQRRQRNRLSMIKSPDDSWITERSSIKREVLRYFQALYTSKGQRNFSPILEQCPLIVLDAANILLTADVNLEEVKTATFQLGAEKAPGPDGINGLFYQKNWEIIKTDLFNEVKVFFVTGIMLPELNKTHISLIPKVKHPERLEQFRPISLCNFGYKIIAKVLANQLKSLMSNLIAEEQSAFVPGRQIQDNILVVQEILHQIKVRKRKKKFQAILKLDMKKAYDRVEWDFLEACLLKFGFAEKWVRWVMQCITTVSFSVKVNGEPLQFFKPSRGIRQGDPLSPYLFILVANVLSMLMQKAVEEGSIKGIKLNSRCPTLSHLLFANDSIFFLDGKTVECQNLATILNQYCMASGQAVNLNKSGIFFSKECPNLLKENMARELRMPILEQTGQYLRIPSDWGASKKNMFAWLLGRVESKLAGWKEKLMSKAGKEVLLKAIVQAIPQYAMSVFKVPVSICKAIEHKIAQF